VNADAAGKSGFLPNVRHPPSRNFPTGASGRPSTIPASAPSVPHVVRLNAQREG
jgi:hypothetical protein